MNLYKRVFPKWTYDPYVPEPVPWVKSAISSTLPEVDMEQWIQWDSVSLLLVSTLGWEPVAVTAQFVFLREPT